MDDFIAILSLLVITGLFIVGFAFSVFFKRPSPNVDTEQRIVVASLIKSLQQFCPIGCKKGWTLVPIECNSPRSWKKKSPFAVFKTKIMLHGSSVIVKSPASVIIDLISKPVTWDEWDSCCFSSSLCLSENDCSELRGDKYMKCTVISKGKKSCSRNHVVMYCFTSLSSDNVRWILFWNVTHLDWWFFLIQSAMRKSDADHCLLTIIRGTDSVSCDDDLAKAVLLRIRNIRDAAELHSFKVFPFNSVMEHCISPCLDMSESKKHHSSCKKRSHTDSCSRELDAEEKSLSKNLPDVLLHLVSFSSCDRAKSESSRKFSVSLIDVQPARSSTLDGGNSECSSHREAGFKTKKAHSLTATETASSTSYSKQLLQEASSELQRVNSDNRVKNSLSFHERSSSASVEQCESPVKRHENNISSSKSKNPDLQNLSPKSKGYNSGMSGKRKQSIVEFGRKSSRVASMESNSNSVADTSKNVLNENESHLEVLVEKSDLLTSGCATTVKISCGEANTDFLDSDDHIQSCSDLSMNATNSEKITTNLNHSSFSSDKSSICEGNCSPICSVCLEAASEDLYDFEILLPCVYTSEERTADLATKGNYCAAELQAEVHEASQVKAGVNLERKHSSGKWLHVSSNKDVVLLIKTKEERSFKISSYLCQTSFPASPSQAWEVLRNPRLRFICDETAKKVTVLEELPEQQKIIYTYHEFGGLLKKEAMDFCLLHSERVEHSKYSLAYFSIEYENCPLSSAMRGMLFPSGWVIEKINGNSDECKISYLVQVVVNRSDSLLVQEANSIVLQSILNLRHYFISAPENVGIR